MSNIERNINISLPRKTISELYNDAKDSNQLIREFIKDYEAKGFQRIKVENFCKSFMETEMVNDILVHYEMPYLSYRIMNEAAGTDRYTHQLATLVFKKSCCIVFNLGLYIGEGDDKYIHKELKSSFPRCDFDFAKLDMRNIQSEYRRISSNNNVVDRKRKGNLPEVGSTTNLAKRPNILKVNNTIISNIRHRNEVCKNVGTIKANIPISSPCSYNNATGVNVSRGLTGNSEDESCVDKSLFGEYLEKKRITLLDQLSKNFNLSFPEREQLSCFLSTYLTYFIQKKYMELKNVDKVTKVTNNSMLRILTFMTKKDSGKILFSKILNNEISPKSLSEYKDEDFCERTISFAANEILYNSELSDHPALQTYMCRKCATMHSRNDSCRRDD
uniref:SPK domain-containing protein n=1 Tax=Strongyloides papillosus TaxID=174720 RepID=A0A0N5BPD9_STREA